MKLDLVFAALFLISCHSTSQASPGELESVAPDLVLTFEYETPALRVLPNEEAARLKANRPFHRLRFATAPPLDAVDEVLSPLPSGPLSLLREGTTHELTLTNAAVERLAKSCP